MKSHITLIILFLVSNVTFSQQVKALKCTYKNTLVINGKTTTGESTYWYYDNIVFNCNKLDSSQGSVYDFNSMKQITSSGLPIFPEINIIDSTRIKVKPEMVTEGKWKGHYKISYVRKGGNVSALGQNITVSDKTVTEYYDSTIKPLQFVSNKGYNNSFDNGMGYLLVGSESHYVFDGEENKSFSELISKEWVIVDKNILGLKLKKESDLRFDF